MCDDAFLGGQLHVVAIHQTEHMVIVVGYGEVYTLELERRQGEDVLGITAVVKWYSHTAGDNIRARETAQDTQYGKDKATVEMEPSHHLPYTRGIIGRGAPYLVHVAYGILS